MPTDRSTRARGSGAKSAPGAEPRRALLYQDASSVPDAVVAALERLPSPVRVVAVDTIPALEAALRARDWDAVVVAGHFGPDRFHAIMARVMAHDDETPVVVAAPALDDDLVVRATAAGARDVVDAGAGEALHDALEDALLRHRPEHEPADGGPAEPGPHLATLQRLANELAGAATTGDAMAAAADALREGLDLPYVETWGHHGVGARFVPGPSSERGATYAALREGFDRVLQLGGMDLVRRVGLRRRSRSVADLRVDRAGFRRADVALSLGLDSLHAAPAVVGRRAAAVILAFGEERRPLVDADLTTIDVAADHLAAAMARIAGDAELSREREQTEALLDHVADGIVACDADGRLTFVNLAMRIIHDGAIGLGQPAEAWIASHCVVHEGRVAPMPRHEIPLFRALGGESFDDSQYVVDPPTGRRRVVRASGQPIVDVAGTVQGAVIAVRDVTDRVAAEAASAAATETALRTYSLLLDDLADLARNVGEAEDLSEVWAGVLAFAHHTLGADEIVVARTVEGGALAPLYAARYLPGRGAEPRSDPASVGPSEGLERAARERLAVIMGDVEHESVRGAGPSPIRSLAAVPMELEGAILGGFEVRADAAAAFDESATVALRMAANIAAIALDYDDLVEDERRARASAELAARHFQKIFDASPVAVAIASLDDDRLIDVNPAMESLVGYARDELVGRRAADLGIWVDAADRAALTEAVRGLAAVRGVEIRLRRKDGGLRTCLLSADATELEGERAMLALVVDISERIEQQQRLRNLARFRESLMSFVGETLELGFDGPFYQRLLASAVEATPNVQAGSLLVRDAGSDTYRFVAAVGYDLEGLQGVTFDDAEIADAHVEGKAMVTGALPTLDERSERGDTLRRFGRLDEIRSTLSVPIYLEGSRVASLALDNFDRDDAFDDESLQLAGAFATQVATLIKRRMLERDLEHMAYHDNLTGLPNRVLFRDRLMQAISRALRTDRRGAAIFLDLDNLKVTNDALGHGIGDELLKGVAQRLQRSLRADDTVARIGGDEFTMVLPDVGDAVAAAGVADKVLVALREPFDLRGNEVHVSASVGITLFPDDATDADLLIQHGDTAMYQAKAHGKDRYRFFTPEMNQQLLERASLESHLRKAIERDELELHFQPRVSLADGRITSVEALARWHQRDRGWVPPATFIPVAEESGLIGAIGAHLLELACSQARSWERDGTPVVVAVNLSARQLQERDLVRTVRETLAATGLDPCLLELELTESAVMHNVEENAVKLDELRTLGVSISIDDFGTGYSSLTYLKRLPATALKIDRSFVRDVGGDVDAAVHDSAIIRAIVALASALDMTAIAEGVETVAQLAFLRSVGCAQGQGYLFARPAPAPELAALLTSATIDLPAT